MEGRIQPLHRSRRGDLPHWTDDDDDDGGGGGIGDETDSGPAGEGCNLNLCAKIPGQNFVRVYFSVSFLDSSPNHKWGWRMS